MKKVCLGMIIAALLVNSQVSAANFYVNASTGNDNSNNGTSASTPFATIARAITAVLGVDKSVAGSTVVTIAGGTYSITTPLTIGESAGGSSVHRVTYKAATGETAIISGGLKVTGWTQTSGKPYFQKLLTQTEVRDLYVNGDRRIRARTNSRITGLGWVLSGTTRVGVYIDQALLPTVAHPEQLELHMQSEWRDAYVPVQSMSASSGRWDLRSNRIDQVSTSTPLAAAPSYALPFFVENAIELLDQPGEWCFDRTSKVLYYYPKSGESIASVDVLAPVCEKLLDINGSSLTSKVTNVRFEGLRFACASWNAPSNEGWYGVQSEAIYRPSTVGGHTRAALNVNNASRIVFYGCHISNTAAVGLAFPNGVTNSTIEGCYFYDNGDAAIMLSKTSLAHNDVAGEEAPVNDTIRNNLVIKAGAVFYGAPAISSFYTDGLIIDHNTISNVPYSGISVGWGWEGINSTCKNNKITGNRVIDYLAICRDGGAIYTLGNQPNSFCENNYFKNAWNEFGGLYFDQGTCYYTVRNNVIDNAPRWLHIWKNTIHDITLSSNWSTTLTQTQKGTDITIEAPTLVTNGNWPAAAQTVMNNSGFNSSFTQLTALLAAQTNAAPAVSISGGSAITISIIDKLTLIASISDDGKPFSSLDIEWRKKSGSGTVTFPSGDEARTYAFFSAAGTYSLECMVKDFKDSASATVTVTVTSATLGTNLALNKSASASSEWDASMTPAKGVDGAATTAWHPSSAESYGTYPWWQVDLGSIVSIGRLELDSRRTTNQPDTRRWFVVDASNDAAFTSPVRFAFQANVPFDFEGTWSFNIVPKINCRYVRISKSLPANNTVADLRVFDVTGVAKELGSTPVLRPISPAMNMGAATPNIQKVLLTSSFVNIPARAMIYDASGKVVNSETFMQRVKNGQLGVYIVKNGRKKF